MYLVDAFGNKELLYRDPEIGCLNPIPLRPRRARPWRRSWPSAVPKSNPAPGAAHRDQGGRGHGGRDERLRQSQAVAGGHEDRRQVRMLQVLPMSVPSGGPPHETGKRVAGRRLGRARPLGAGHRAGRSRRQRPFHGAGQPGDLLPGAGRERAGRPVDAFGHPRSHGRAAGLRRLSRIQAQASPSARRTAAGPARPPSPLEPDVDGSNPFSYPRLVQPVLDRHCVECHAEKDKAPNLAASRSCATGTPRTTAW
jgi:hypothetical protein